MATTHVEQEESPGIAKLITGIMQDGQELMRQQLQLFQVELKNDLHRTKDASILVIIGGGTLALAGFFLLVTGALLISYLWPAIPYWGGFAIVGGVLLAVGLAFFLAGKSKFDAFNPLPDQTVQGLKETVQWKTKK